MHHQVIKSPKERMGLPAKIRKSHDAINTPTRVYCIMALAYFRWQSVQLSSIFSTRNSACKGIKDRKFRVCIQIFLLYFDEICDNDSYEGLTSVEDPWISGTNKARHVKFTLKSSE